MSTHIIHLQNIELLLERRSELSIYVLIPFKKRKARFFSTYLKVDQLIQGGK